MKIPFFWIALGFSLGIFASGVCFIPSVYLWILFAAGVPLLWISRGKKIFLPQLILLFFCLGYLYAYADHERPENAVEQYSGSPISLEGAVKSPPEIRRHGRKVMISLILASENVGVRNPSGKFSKHFTTKILKTSGDVQVFLFQPDSIPSFGDRIRLWGRLERPRAAANPGEFDYARYLSRQKIYGVFKSFGRKSVRILGKGNESYPVKKLFECRAWLSGRIDHYFAGNQAILFKALILGDRNGLSNEIREDFMKTGTAHLLAISGQNISLVAGSFYLLLIAAGVRQKIAAAAGFLAVIAYVFIAGLGIPVQRAGWMAATGFLALLFEREREVLNSFFLAFTILLIFQPRALFNVSFQLSFISVFCLILFFKKFRGGVKGSEVFMQGLAVLAGTFPVLIYYFNIFSPISLIANLGAIPLFDLALLFSFVSLALGALPLAGVLLIKTSGFWLESGLRWIHGLAKIPWGYFYLPSPSPGRIVLYYLAAALFLTAYLLRKKLPRVILAASLAGWIFCAGLFFWNPRGADFELVLFTAGRNELAHLQWAPGDQWLINAGRRLPSDQAQWILSPFLRSKGIKHLSAILLTDFAKKHTGGLDTLERNFSSDRLIYPLSKKKQNIPAWNIKQKMSVSADDRLAAADGRAELRVWAVVRDQIIFSISKGGLDVLFLPALNEEILKELQRQQEALKPTDILILPSLKEISEPALKKLFNGVDPEVVTLPYYSAALKDFLTDRDIRFLDLETHGAVTFSLTPSQGMEKIQIRSVLKGPIAEWKL